MLPALRSQLLHRGGYEFHGGWEVHEFDATSVTDTAGRVTRGDLVVLCLGSRAALVSSMLSAPNLLRRSRLQMLQTEPVDVPLRTIVADVHTLARHNLLPPSVIEALSPADPRLGNYDLRFSCLQRTNGALVLGEVRESEEPFDFDLAERPAAALLSRLSAMTGRPPPTVVRRWSGVLHECIDGRLWHREDLDDSVVAVTGADQRGITLAPLIARDTFDWVLDGHDSGGSRRAGDRRRGRRVLAPLTGYAGSEGARARPTPHPLRFAPGEGNMCSLSTDDASEGTARTPARRPRRPASCTPTSTPSTPRSSSATTPR